MFRRLMQRTCARATLWAALLFSLGSFFATAAAGEGLSGFQDRDLRAFAAEPIWHFDSDLDVRHVATADLNGDLVPDVIAGEYSNNYYGNPSRVYAINGATGIELWHYQLQDGVRSMTVGDINNDGTIDVIAGAAHNTSGTPDGRVHAIDGKDGSEIWTFYIGVTISAVAIGDFNGDVYMDVTAGDFDGNVYAINGETGAQLWMTPISSLWINAVATGDVNGDNVDDVAYAHEYLAGWDNFLGVFDGVNGSAIWTDTVDYVVLDVILSDVDDDSHLEAVFSGITSGDQGYIYVRSAWDGGAEWQYNLGGINHTNGDISLYTHDLDEDGDIDLVIGNFIGWNEVIAFNGDGPTPMMVSETLEASPKYLTFGDVIGDGQLEIIAATGDRVQVLGALDGKKLWYYSVAGTIQSVAVGDFDDDSIADVAAGGGAEHVGSDPGKTVWALKTVTSPLLWEYALNQYGNACAIADLTGDEYMDVVAVTSVDDRAIAVNGLTGTELWTWTGTANLYNVTAGDFDGNGQVDVAVAGDDETITAIDGGDHSVMWQFTTPTNQLYRKCLRAADMNGDDKIDVIGGCDNGTVYAVNGETGLELWSTPVGAGVSEIRLAQMNGLGPLDVVVAVGTGASGEKVVVLDGEGGSQVWQYVCPEGVEHIELLDVNGDDSLDVAAAITPFGTKQVVMIDGVTHTQIWSTPVAVASNTYGMAQGDLNGDDVPDVVVPGNSTDRSVHALSGVDGGELWSYLTGGEVNCVLVQDMNGDGQLDVVAGSDDQTVYVIDGNRREAYWTYTTGGDVMHIQVGEVAGAGLPSIACVTFDGDGVVYAFDSFYEGTCCLNRGNVDGIIGAVPVDINDLTYLVEFLFNSGPLPPCEEEGNVDGITGTVPIDINDLTYLVDYLFGSGPAPPPC